jgi:hypothetical protein
VLHQPQRGKILAELLIARTGSIHGAVAKALKDAGVIVVQMDHPEEARFIRAASPISDDRLLSCAIEALDVSSDGAPGWGDENRKIFVRKMRDVMREAIKSTKPPDEPAAIAQPAKEDDRG